MKIPGFTIRIYVPDGDPDGVRIIDRMNWTGRGIVFPRHLWSSVKYRPELAGPGIYILSGPKPNSDDDLPHIYIGQGDIVSKRLDQHDSNKDFWNRGIIFTSTGSMLHRGHVTWLEHMLIRRAEKIGQCTLENGTSPNEPNLPEADKADTSVFLLEILQILPLVGLRAFEEPKAVAAPQQSLQAAATISATSSSVNSVEDTVVVPAKQDGFAKVFIGENQWHAIRIGGGKLPMLKYIAAYQTAPVQAVTHYAAIDRIEPYGEEGKYRVLFSGAAKPLGPIPYADATPGTLQGPRYTSLAKLLSAKKVMDLF